MINDYRNYERPATQEATQGVRTQDDVIKFTMSYTIATCRRVHRRVSGTGAAVFPYNCRS